MTFDENLSLEVFLPFLKDTLCFSIKSINQSFRMLIILVLCMKTGLGSAVQVKAAIKTYHNGGIAFNQTSGERSLST